MLIFPGRSHPALPLPADSPFPWHLLNGTTCVLAGVIGDGTLSIIPTTIVANANKRPSLIEHHFA